MFEAAAVPVAQDVLARTDQEATGPRPDSGSGAEHGGPRGARRGGARTPRRSGSASAPAVHDADELVDRLRRGDDGAIESLVARYGTWIHRVARRILRDPRDAEEVTQDVLWTALRKIDSFKGDAAFSSWLYRIAVNAAYQRLRRQGPRAEVSLEPFLPVFDEAGRLPGSTADWSMQLDDPAVAAEIRKALDAAIGQLPDAYRVVFVLRDVEGMSTAEVGQLLGLSVPGVKTRLHRARLALRHQLSDLLAPAG
jgi:RNA polymerase sigma-70 factor, ECF subfamily